MTRVVDAVKSTARPFGIAPALPGVAQAFRDQGIGYHVSRWTKADAYLELEPLLLQGRVELLDHPDLRRELSLLERRYHAGGRVSVDHPSGHHDDHANALALAALVAVKNRPRDWEDKRPEGEDYSERFREEEIEEAKTAALAKGVPQEWLTEAEAKVNREYLAAYIEERAERDTLKGRMRRAGLRSEFT